jgi:hypothetical protein
MERMDRYSIGILSDHRRETFAHILRSILSKSQTEYIGREIVSCLEYIGDTSCEELSLATAWSSDDEYWTVYGLYGFTLARIERCEDGFEIFHSPIL